MIIAITVKSNGTDGNVIRSFIRYKSLMIDFIYLFIYLFVHLFIFLEREQIIYYIRKNYAF